MKYNKVCILCRYPCHSFKITHPYTQTKLVTVCREADLDCTGTKKHLSTRLVEYHSVGAEPVTDNDSEGEDGFELYDDESMQVSM